MSESPQLQPASVVSRSLLTVLLLATGCQGVVPRVDNVTQPLPSGGLTNLQPADIAVAPVRNQTERENVPVDVLREALCQSLVERLYSPLDLAYVDGFWSESSFVGEVPPDALLVVAMTRWDTSRIFTTGTVLASAELRLFRGGRAEGEALWGAAVSRRIELSDGDRPPSIPREQLIPRAVELFADEALEELPERDVIEAHR